MRDASGYSRVGFETEVEPFPTEFPAPPRGKTPSVRFVYLVPADRKERPDFISGIRYAASHLSQWFFTEVGAKKTFRLSDPVVDIYRTPNPSGWYAEETGGRSFWTNVLHDGFQLSGGRFNDPENIWIYYIDAVDKDGAGGAGTSGVAILTSHDLEGLVGERGPICRWIGGLGHEMGHAFGLPHPPECSGGSRQPEPPCNSLMYLGYDMFPKTYLIAGHKQTLAAHAFFNNPKLRKVIDCTNLSSAAEAQLPPSQRELARQWFEGVWNTRSRETIFSLVHPECVGHHEGENSKGPAEIEAMRDRLLSLLPDLTVTIEEILSDENDAVVRWRFTGTHSGTDGPIAATGRSVSFAGMTWLKFQDGRIVEGWDSWNQAALIQQLQAPA